MKNKPATDAALGALHEALATVIASQVKATMQEFDEEGNVIEGGNVLEEAKGMIGTRYDLLSLLSFPFRIEAQESKKVTCVEFVSELLHRHGIINVPNTHRLTPYQLYLILINIGWSRRVTA